MDRELKVIQSYSELEDSVGTGDPVSRQTNK